MRGVRIAAALAVAVAGSATARQPKVGDMAPDFSVKTFDGATRTLADFRGKVLVINYWATWCGPCKVELPLLESYYRRQVSNGLEVVAVTTEDSLPRSALGRLDAALEIPLANRMRSKGAYAPIGGAVPTNYVIDRAGRIRWAKAGAFTAEAMVSIIAPLLREPAP